MPFEKTCVGCGSPFTAPTQRRQFHSLPCFAQWRERQPWWRAVKLGSYHTRVIARAKQVVRTCASKMEAYLAGRLDGRRAGYKSGYAAGYAAARRQAHSVVWSGEMQRRGTTFDLAGDLHRPEGGL
jgi:hypothetical protein